MTKEKNGAVISLGNISKEFRTLNRREGLKGSILDLFSRNYKIIKAVNGISFDIQPGEKVGLLGPNGAGKSTAIKMMSGVLKPTSGEIRVNGVIPYNNRTKNAQNIGVVFGQRTQLWWALPLIESFKLLKDIYLIEDADYKNMLELYKSIIDLEPLLKKPVRQMSLGQRTLSDILASFLHNPKVVFLDEPTIGLDVSMKSKIRELVLELNRVRNTTVILTTHDIGDVDALCERVIIIDKGSKLYDNSIEELKHFFGSYRTLKIMFDKKAYNEKTLLTDVDELQRLFGGIEHADGIVSVSKNEEWIDILVDEDKCAVVELLSVVRKYKKVADIKLDEISTEEVIKRIYEGD
ncbi:MAG: ATP-binding cassette domain-containing protein [Oscillospiraceae bacterium]|nr:ATP-binding cassette domain-containing protein [Oscillospiraceae bacterium]